MSSHDIYSYGVVSSSSLYRIRDPFPAAEGYAEIVDVGHMVGGEATNSSIVLSRLAAKVKLDGNWLGADENGRRTKALLSEFGIDTERLPLREGHRTVQEVVFAAAGTRTIFGTYGRMLEEAAWNAADEKDISQANVVSLDPFFGTAAARVAEIAAHSGVPVVTVDCRYDDALLEHVSAVVVAESFLRENYEDRKVEDVFERYLAATGGMVIFTFGDAPGRYARSGGATRHFQPYTIDPVDTAGGGDAFRAGIVYGFLKGWTDERMIEFAAALAAIICTRSPGVLNAPTRDEVDVFMRAAGRGDHASEV